MRVPRSTIDTHYPARYIYTGLYVVIALDETHSRSVLSLFGFFFVKLQLELVRVTRETSRHRHRRHPSRRGLAQIDRLRAGDRYSLVVVFVRQIRTKFHPVQAFNRNREISRNQYK